MSHLEFDTYLSLLCRLLRIAPQERERVAEEFRTHMEDRLDELLAKGMGREAAVKLALDEFGDAAGLAAQMASISQGRKKRWIMRISAFSFVGLAAAVLLAVALWPEGARVKAPQVVAQTGDESPPAGGGGVPAPTKGKPATSVEEKLARRTDVDYPETPFKEVLLDLKDRMDLQIYVNAKAITAGEVSLDAPITINLKGVRLDMALDLILEQAGEGKLEYVERDGILIVSTSEALSGASEVKVYNCRDILAMTSPVPSGGGMMMPGMPGLPGMPGGFGLPGAPGGIVPAERPSDDEGPKALPPGGSTPPKTRTKGTPPTSGAAAPAIPWGVHAQFGGGGIAAPAGGGMGMMPGMPGGVGMPSGGMGNGGPAPPRTDEEIRAERLMHLITTAVKPDSWQDMGGFGTISEYKGLIVINHNARTHKEVEKVLTMLREAAGLPQGGPMMGQIGDMMGAPGPGFIAPGGGPPGAGGPPPRR